MLSLPPADQAQPYQQFELLPRLVNALFKWKWLIVLFTFAVAVPVCAVIYFKTPLYQVAMKILIKSTRSQLAINMSGSAQGVIASAVTLPLINSEIQILKSQDLLLEAIARSGYPLLAPGVEDTPITRERALQALRIRMYFNPVPDSNVIEVGIQDPDPKQAARLLEVLATLYLKKHALIQAGSDATPEFFTKQVQFHKAKVDRARDALEKFQEKDNIISVSQETELNLGRLMAMEGTLKALQAEIESTTKEIAALEGHVKDQPEEVTKERSVVLNPEVNAMRTRLVDLRQQRHELLQRYTPASRFVKDKEAEIAALEAAIEGKEPSVVGGTIFAQNRIKESLAQELLTKRVALESGGAKRKTLLEEKKSYEARLEILKDRTFDLGRLRGDFDLARETYSMYQRKAEEARVSRAMDEENIVNAGMIQPPVAPAISLPRNLLMWGPLSAAAGALLGVALALALEFFNVTIKDENDVERFLQVPVLATVRQF